MKKICLIKGKLSLILVAAIAVLCAGFLIMSCGTNSSPQQKAEETDRGAYAVDFSVCPNDFCYANYQGSSLRPIPSVADRELTVEAWVKSRAATVNGGIFRRMDDTRGVALYIEANKPTFAIRVQTAATSTPGSPTPSALYTVTLKSDTSVSIDENEWHHIAGVLTNSAHSHYPTSTTCSETVMAETPHLDLYIDGVFENCATTWGGADDPATGAQYADNPGGEIASIGNIAIGSIVATQNLEAVIDELRIWGRGKSASEIVACINSELGLSGTCNRNDSNLAAYFRFNEGHEETITDFSINGFSTGLVTRTTGSADEPAFTTGWVSGSPSLQRAD